MPDVTHGPTMEHGVSCRVFRDLPELDRELLRDFDSFVDKRVSELIVPITDTQLLTEQEWLERTHYNGSRRKELSARGDMDVSLFLFCAKFLVNKAFGKLYLDLSFKTMRGIISRSDEFKMFSGRYFKSLEDQLYASDCYIKHVPVKDRVGHVLRFFEDQCGPYWETDFSSCESGFSVAFLRACEIKLYNRAFKNFPLAAKAIEAALTGQNVCKFKKFTVKIFGRRMSGEMCTSLGNTFSTQMLLEFVAKKQGVVIKGLYEGDDSLFCCPIRLDSDLFLRLGFRIKIEKRVDLYSSGFCGLNFSRDLCSMTDPRRVLMTFGWTTSRLRNSGDVVLRGLLRAKAFSLLYEHPRCPVLSVLAARTLKLTEGVIMRFESNWYDSTVQKESVMYNNQTQSEYVKGISLEARFCFEELYHIDVKTQLLIEHYLKTEWCGGMLADENIVSLFEEHTFDACRKSYEHYTGPKHHFQ